MTDPDLKRALIDLLAQSVDRELEPHGFKRRPGGSRYGRRYGDGRQAIDVGLDHGVPWRPLGCQAQVVARLEVKLPDLSRTLASLLDPNIAGLVDPEVILSLPAELIAGAKPTPTWYLCASDADRATFEEFGSYLREYVVPFAAQYSTVRGVLDAFEAGDRVPALHDSWWLRIVAAFIYVGDRDRALEVMKDHLGSALPRRLYAETWRQLLASSAAETAHDIAPGP